MMDCMRRSGCQCADCAAFADLRLTTENSAFSSAQPETERFKAVAAAPAPMAAPAAPVPAPAPLAVGMKVRVSYGDAFRQDKPEELPDTSGR